MEISITKNNVYAYAAALTARAATATDAYAQTAITEDNYAMLDVYLSEAVTAAEGELRKKLSQSHAVDMKLEDDTVVIRTKEEWRGDAAVYNLTESSIRLFLAYHIASRWLQTSPASSLAEVYGTTAATHLMTATETLNQKEEFHVDEADYADREGEDACMTEGAGTNSDYACRENEGTSMADDNEANSDYARRKGDNLMARPGIRITAHEALTVRSGECCCRQEPAVTTTTEHLLSNP